MSRPSWLSRRTLLLALAGAAVAVVVLLSMREESLAVDTSLVRRCALEATVSADGFTRVRERFGVVAPVAGRLLRLDVREGTPVRRGDVVAKLVALPLEPSANAQLRARLDAALALEDVATGQLRMADQDLALRRRETERARRLHDAGGIADRDLELSEAALDDAGVAADAARQRVRVARNDVQQARAALTGDPAARADTVLVRAPAAGVVLNIADVSERIVASGTPLLEVGNPAVLELVVDVLSDDAMAITRRAPVRVRGWRAAADLEHPEVQARVRDVQPAAFTRISALGVEERRVNVIMDFEGSVPAVGDGYRIEAQVVTWSAPDVVCVPLNALVRQDAEGEDAWSVWVITEGRANPRSVRIGHLGDGAAEVLGGLAVGDEVILFPSDALRPRLRVASEK